MVEKKIEEEIGEAEHRAESVLAMVLSHGWNVSLVMWLVPINPELRTF